MLLRFDIVYFIWFVPVLSVMCVFVWKDNRPDVLAHVFVTAFTSRCTFDAFFDFVRWAYRIYFVVADVDAGLKSLA